MLNSQCHVITPGKLPYLDAWALQKQLADARGRDEIPDTLLLVEHPHTYTLGSSAKRENLIWSEAERTARGIELHQVDRGGDVTYHGTGSVGGVSNSEVGAGDGWSARRRDRVCTRA